MRFRLDSPSRWTLSDRRPRLIQVHNCSTDLIEWESGGSETGNFVELRDSDHVSPKNLMPSGVRGVLTIRKANRTFEPCLVAVTFSPAAIARARESSSGVEAPGTSQRIVSSSAVP